MNLSRISIITRIAIASYICIGWEVVFATCAIEKGPPPQVASYIQETTKKANALLDKYPNICGERRNSPISSLNATLGILDKAAILNNPNQSSSLMGSIVTDFTYNVYTLSLGNTSPIVIQHGGLFYTLERSVLMPTLDALSNRCQLGGGARAEITGLLQYNNYIQDFFKNTVIGNINQSNSALEKEIIMNYQGESVSTCSNNMDLSTAIEKGTKAIEAFGTDIDESIKNWKESMILLQGGNADTRASYNQLQKTLLEDELKRQGLSQGAIEQMVTNLTCMQKEANGISSIAEWSRVRAKCIGNPIIGYQKVIDSWNEIKFGISKRIDTFKSLSIETPKDSTAFMMTQNKIESHANEEISILRVYGLSKTEAESLWDEQATTNAIIHNLANMHIALIGVNDRLKKRIPIMQANCMKGNPGIVGGCYSR